MKLILTAITLVALPISVAAQWLNHSTPGILRRIDRRCVTEKMLSNPPTGVR